jgi:hypothetical protein
MVVLFDRQGADKGTAAHSLASPVKREHKPVAGTLAARSLVVQCKYALMPHGSACLSRNATAQSLEELSGIMRARRRARTKLGVGAW